MREEIASEHVGDSLKTDGRNLFLQVLHNRDVIE